MQHLRPSRGQQQVLLLCEQGHGLVRQRIHRDREGDGVEGSIYILLARRG